MYRVIVIHFRLICIVSAQGVDERMINVHYYYYYWYYYCCCCCCSCYYYYYYYYYYFNFQHCRGTGPAAQRVYLSIALWMKPWRSMMKLTR